ncbi:MULTISPECIES: ABC transporter permease [Dickeya]|uniref:Alkanesulfonates transport system permease protein n=1 Tax=Dickeya aquatica TaxID=1401087 RepID=A0A375A8V8_9GAMM|nr:MULTISPECIES: ABC transporter permease [Dickeya]SLM62514.1 Alkanesulfonates transport system permease protein [Dickeya aquatica]
MQSIRFKSAAWPVASTGLMVRTLPLLMPLLLATLWALTSHYGWMSALVLPSPLTVMHSAATFVPQELAAQLWISLLRLGCGLLGGIMLGMVLGMLFGLSRTLERAGMPLFNVLAQTPTLAWIPLLMLTLGIGEALKLTVLIKAVSVPMTLCVCSGIQQTPRALHEIARTLQLPWWTRLRRLTLPVMLPHVMTGVRLAFSQGWVSLMAVELLASSEGLGYLLVQSRQLFMLDMVLVCIVVIGAFGVAGEHLLWKLEQRWIFWPPPAPGQRHDTASAATSKFIGWILPAFLCLWWQLAGAQHESTFLPAPTAVLAALFTPENGWEAALATSLTRTLAGFMLGASAGCLLGCVLGRYTVADRLLTPLLSALRGVALFAWLPLLTAWFGLSERACIAFITLSAFFPLLLACQQGMRARPVALEETARVLQLGFWQRQRYLTLPAMLPALFAGLRLSLMHAWVGAIGADYFIASGDGLGSQMIRAQQLFQSERVIAGVMLIALVSTLFYHLMARAEQHLNRWRLR